jgi:hypothetical protein
LSRFFAKRSGNLLALTILMSSADKLKLPEIRLLTPQENQQLTDLAEDIAQKMLGPDWKERQEERRAALNEKIAKQ